MNDSIQIRFTQQPVRVSATGAQSIYQVVDLGGRYRVLDLLLSVYNVGGSASPTLQVKVQTSMEATDDDGWVTLGTYPAMTVANSYERLSMTGALRYVRYYATLTGTSPVFVFDLSGYARAWS